MCSLPKITFYLYFGFFFLGYLWIFGIYFYNTQAITNNNNNNNQLRKFKENELDHHPAADDFNQQSSAIINPVDLRALAQSSAGQAIDAGGAATACPLLRTEPPFHLCLYPPDVDTGFSASVHLRKLWEPELTDFIVQALKQYDKAVFLDIGGYLGYYSMLAAALGHSVLTIEPFPENHLRLARSALLNAGFDQRITLLPIAVSSEPNEQLFFSENESNFGGRFVVETDEDRFKFRERQKTPFPAMTLDQVIQRQKHHLDRLAAQSINKDASNINHHRRRQSVKLFQVGNEQRGAVGGDAVDEEKRNGAGGGAENNSVLKNSKQVLIMKIDVEGHECHVIQGATNLLLNSDNTESDFFVPLIVMEWEETRKKAGTPCVQKMIRTLTNGKFRPFTVNADRQDPIDMNRLSDPHDMNLPQDILWKRFGS